MRVTSSQAIFKAAQEDPRVVFVGSDLGFGAMDDMKAAIPERFFMEGVAEQYLVGMAAGLAIEGFIPFVNSLATFLTRRCFEQILIDVCFHNLPVRLVGNGGGLVYGALGPTHLAVDDFAILRSSPNLLVLAPGDAFEVESLYRQLLTDPRPAYIRLGAKAPPQIHASIEGAARIGKAIRLLHGETVALLSTGAVTSTCINVAARLKQHEINISLVHFHTVKPLDEKMLREMSENHEIIVTVEEHLVTGGFGSAVVESIYKMPGLKPQILMLGVAADSLSSYGSRDELLAANGLTEDGIADAVVSQLRKTSI